MTLQEKVLDVFSGKVVRKDLAFLVKGGLPVPTYVLEYLLGQYCASSDETVIAEGVEKVKSVIRNNYVNRADSEIVKGKIHDLGQFKVIDKVSVILNDKLNRYEAKFANLDLGRVPISGDIVQQNQKLLSGNGVWSIVTLSYDSSDNSDNRWSIEYFKPIQISSVDVNEYISKRKEFTTEEWIDFLVHTVGLNPDVLSEREKMIALSRLLPHVESNFNFMELGPKGTGKSHVFQELSPYGVLVSGGDVTSARLFVKMSGNREILGLVGYWDVVAWDEYEQQPGKTVDAVMIDTMQNYLANKSFNRGKATHEASASMAFVGNTKRPVNSMLRNSHLFESIPHQFIKGAFLDRIHLYNPGWEVQVLKKTSFSNGYGLITDYIAAILHEMRKMDFSGELTKYAQFNTSLSERDHLAIRKTFSGLIKLIYPDGVFSNEEAYKLIDYATECRKRVKDQLYIIDETFRNEPAKFEYTNLKNGQAISIETLERLNFATAERNRKGQNENFSIDTTTSSIPEISPQNDVASQTTLPINQQTEKIEILKEKEINLRSGQTGYSYANLFAAYLKKAKQITIEDPYIRKFWQIRNFAEFMTMLIETRDVDGLKVHLVTNSEEYDRKEIQDALIEIQGETEPLGLEFTYEFRNFHDRSIVTDDGWKIALGRGLDIFEPYNKYSIAASSAMHRKCRECTIIFKKSN
jgi:ATP-dependent Lon protease